MTDQLPPPMQRAAPRLIRAAGSASREPDTVLVPAVPARDDTPTALPAPTPSDGVTRPADNGRPGHTGHPGHPGHPGHTEHLSRRERLITMRGISIPTSIIRRFFQIDGIRKAMLMAFNLFISIVPLMIIAFALVSRVRNRISLSQVFIEQFHLNGETAVVVRGAFPPTRNIIKVASVIAVGSFALSGFDVASVFQRTFADAWNVKHYRGWRGPVRGAAWFMLVFGTFAFGQLLQRVPAKHGAWAYGISIPIVLVMHYWFWAVTPRLLLDKPLAQRDLRPGAILGMIGSTALWVLSLVILPGWFSWYGRGFGGVGIALAMLSWTYVVSIVWVVIVVISAVMWERSAPIDEVIEVSDGMDSSRAPG